MPRKCLVCESPHLKEIDRSLVAGEAYRVIAQRCAISPDAVQRHKTNHLPKALVKAKAIEEGTYGDTLLDQVRKLLNQAERLTQRAETAGSLDTALRGIAQVKGVLELLGQVSGQLAGKGTQIAVAINTGGPQASPSFRTMSDSELRTYLKDRGHQPPLLEAQIIEGDLQHNDHEQ